MKRVILLMTVVVLVACSASGRVPRVNMPALMTERAIGEVFHSGGVPEGFIGNYDAIAIDWPSSMGGLDLSNLQREVLRLAFGEDYNGTLDVHDAIFAHLPQVSSLPVPHHIHDDFYNSTDFEWIGEGDMPNFYFNLNLVSVIDKKNGRYVSYSRQTYGWVGAVAHIYYGYLLFDLARNEALTHYDIFTKGSDMVLVKAIIAKLIEDYDAKNYDALKDILCFMIDTDLPPLPKNIGYKEGNFVFTYNPYEIACGNAGDLTVEMPAKQFSGILTPRAKTLLLGK